MLHNTIFVRRENTHTYKHKFEKVTLNKPEFRLLTFNDMHKNGDGNQKSIRIISTYEV